MANSLGYQILRNIVPTEMTKKAAEVLSGQKQHPREKYDAYEVPHECYQIMDRFLENANRTQLADFLTPTDLPSKPDNIFAGIFRETNADPKKLKTAEEREVYVTFALTNLSPSNGWYTFYASSRKNQPMTSLKPVTLELNAGDAMIWRGDLIYFHSPGGGGAFLTLVYLK